MKNVFYIIKYNVKPLEYQNTTKYALAQHNLPINGNVLHHF